MTALDSCSRVRFFAPVKSAPRSMAPSRNAPSKSAPRKFAFVASTFLIFAPRSDAPLRSVRRTKAPCKSSVLFWVTSADLTIGFSNSATEQLHDLSNINRRLVISLVDFPRSQISLKELENWIRKIGKILRYLPQNIDRR